MNWRPREWRENTTTSASQTGLLSPYASFPIVVPSSLEWDILKRQLFEAGADAMLEALKKEGEYYKWKRIATVKVPGLYQEQWKGWFTFIPDEEEKCQ